MDKIKFRLGKFLFPVFFLQPTVPQQKNDIFDRLDYVHTHQNFDHALNKR
jgi:hypothetical protein